MQRWSLALGVGACIAGLGVPAVASARIVRLDIEQRGPAFGGTSFGDVGPYELLRGHAYGELDPADPHNQIIVDVSRAPRNARGLVEYRTDVLILRPVDPARANGRVLFELNNRGDMRAFWELNGAAARTLDTADGAGLGFTMRQGYVIVEAGWDGTVAAGPGLFTIQVPTARQADGAPIVGVSLQEFVIDNAQVLRGPLTYRAATLDKGKASLTMRALYSDAPRPLAADAWEFVDDKTVGLLPRGTAFTEGTLYEFTYVATDPLVVGVGFAAVRDLATHIRQSDVTGRPAERIYTFGASQPIRFAHDFLKLGFNQGEDGRQVFDGMLNWIGGASGGFFNYRFAQPGRTHRQHIGRWYPEFEFPFANQVLTDPVTGATDGRMRRCEATATCPRIFEVNSGNEYWAKGMSLLHTDTNGRDIPDAPNSRSYLLASLPHGPTRQSSLCQQPPNPLSAGPTLRALLTALDEWVTHDTAPPPSRLPRVGDGTLVPAGSQQAVGFPAIPGVVFTGRAHTGDLFDFGPDWRAGILSQMPPTLLGTPYPVLVPKTDGDGLDLGGVRQVEVAVPTATYTGWGLRRGRAAGDGCDHIGQRIPFASTRAEREQTGDPRRSLEERYPTHDQYVEQVTRAARALVAARFLLQDDADRYIRDARNSRLP